MMPHKQGRSGFEKFESLDEAIGQFRKFATEKLVNIIVVIHPKKEDDQFSLGLSSIFGTAKATQESDLVLILQRLSGDIFLDVKKNRFDGDVGRVSMEFSALTSSFYEVEDRPEKQARKQH
jgi:twinkle protein